MAINVPTVSAGILNPPTLTVPIPAAMLDNTTATIACPVAEVSPSISSKILVSRRAAPTSRSEKVLMNIHLSFPCVSSATADAPVDERSKGREDDRTKNQPKQAEYGDAAEQADENQQAI